MAVALALGGAAAGSGAAMVAGAGTSLAAGGLAASSRATTIAEARLFAVTCAGASDCWAVGATNSFGQVPVFQWNGASWAVRHAQQPARGHYSELFGVTCVSRSECWAVGDDITPVGGELAIIERYDGVHWSMVPVPAPGAASRLTSVSCSSATTCWAVGSTRAAGASSTSPLVERFNGTAWTAGSVQGVFGSDEQVVSVACPLSSECYAVGQYSVPGKTLPLVEHWNGSTWTVMRQPAAAGTATTLTSVACSSPTFCQATGLDSSTAFSETWNGSSWAVARVASPAWAVADLLDAVSCTDRAHCVAVGSASTTDTSSAFGVRWVGSAWTSMVGTNPAGTFNALQGVACTSVAFCVAVGYDGGNPLLEVARYGSWTVTPVG